MIDLKHGSDSWSQMVISVGVMFKNVVNLNGETLESV